MTTLNYNRALLHDKGNKMAKSIYIFHTIADGVYSTVLHKAETEEEARSKLPKDFIVNKVEIRPYNELSPDEKLAKFGRTAESLDIAELSEEIEAVQKAEERYAEDIKNGN